MNTFEITIRQQHEKTYPVEVYYSSNELPVFNKGKFSLDQVALLRLETDPRGYGIFLGKNLFQGNIRDSFLSALARSEERLHVLLHVEDATLQSLRWERLCAPLDGDWLPFALTQRVPFSHYLPSPIDDRFRPIGRQQLRALIIAVSPGRLTEFDLQPFDVAAAVQGVQTALNTIPSTVLAQLDGAAGPPTLNALCKHITAESYTLLHLICHASRRRDHESKKAKTALLLSKDDDLDSVDVVTEEQLIERLSTLHGPYGLPHFAFLSACESASTTGSTEFGGLAQRLVRDLGIPAVLAMTDRVSIDTANTLAATFYERLRMHGEVDRALVEATAGLAGRYDITVPALYTRLRGQPLFNDSLNNPLTQEEIAIGLARMQALFPIYAPELIEELTGKIARINPTTEPGALPAAARHERGMILDQISMLCEEIFECTFPAFARGYALPPYDNRCPFRGLAAFQAADHEFFFGRTELVKQLVDRLDNHPFLIILGPSGCGKSSLVLAGLIPALQSQTAELRVTTMRPGDNPPAYLQAALESIGFSAMNDTVKDSAPHQDPSAALLIVDQFEELFSLCTDSERRSIFLDQLLALEKSCRIVLTMRADFLGECAYYPRLREHVQAHQEIIPPLVAEDLRAVVEQQANVVQLRFEADLGNTIVKEVKGEPGAMPLLQHALKELWRRRHGRWLLVREYRETGGVEGAIAHTANDIYEKKLTDSEKKWFQEIFVRLTRIDVNARPNAERRDTRQRIRLADLVPDGADPAPTKELIRRLADVYLVVTSTNPISDEEEVEIAHEALIRSWPTLREWLDRDRKTLQQRQELSEAAQKWEQSNRDPALLTHHGKRLSELIEDLKDISLNTSERAYLQACNRRERANRQRTQLLIVFALIALVAIGAALLLRQRQIQAQEARNLAEQLRKEADSRRLASVAQSQVGVDDDLALLLAVEAGRVARTFEADTMLRTLAGRRGRPLAVLAGHPAGRLFAAWSPDGTHILTTGTDGIVGIWRVGKYTSRITLTGHTRAVEFAAWSKDGTRLVTASQDGTARVWNLLSNQEVWSFTGHTGAILYTAWSRDDTQILTAGEDSTVRVWDVATGRQTMLLNHHSKAIYYAVWSPDGQAILTAGGDGVARIWDSATGKVLLELRGHTREIRSAIWSSDQSRILTASGDGTARVWSPTTGTELLTLRGHVGGVRSAIWSNDQARILTAGEDGTARVWNANTGATVLSLVGHSDVIYDALWSHDETRILTASRDTTTRIWDATTGAELFRLTGHHGPVDRAIWHPHNDQILTASEDGTARVWDTLSQGEGAILQAHTGPVNYVSWHPTDARLATAGEDGIVRVWDTERDVVVAVLQGHMGPVYRVRWSHNGKRIVTTSQDETARIWGINTGAQIVLRGHTGAVYEAVWNEDDTRIATVGEDRTLRVWDSMTGQEQMAGEHDGRVFYAAWYGARIATSSEHAAYIWDMNNPIHPLLMQTDDDVRSLAWSPDGSRLVTAEQQNIARIWDSATGAELRRLVGHKGAVYFVAWSNDGTQILTASKDSTVRIWDATTGEERYILAGHEQPTLHAAWNHDSSLILTASQDGTARIWDASTGAEWARLTGHAGSVLHAAWSSDGARVATAGIDGDVRVRYVYLNDLLEIVCRRAVRKDMEAQQKIRYLGNNTSDPPCSGTP